MSIFLNWFLFILLITICGTAIWAFVIWWRRDHYRREKFAFLGFSSLLGLGSFYIFSLFSGNSLIYSMVSVFLQLFGAEISQTPLSLSPLEAVFSLLIFVALAYIYLQTFRHWDGQKSYAQYEQEQNNETPDVVRDIALFLSSNPVYREKLQPYQEDTESHHSILKKPQSLAWQERAKDLWLLRNRAYKFADEYFPEKKCWLGEEKNTGALAILACYHDEPEETDIISLAEYAQKITDNKHYTDIELIFAIKNNSKFNIKEVSGCTLRIITEDELLEGLVNFEDYFSFVRKIVEEDHLDESDTTLQDTYTPSFYRENETAEAGAQTLEDFIINWLHESTNRQLAVLGEYGQGKSTAAKMVCYRLLKTMQTSAASNRIPILIELRGKTLRTMTPEELLSIWAGNYHIDAQALWHLHLAGRLLLIFEGFDEIDLSGDTEARIQHFRTLWQFNHDTAKLIITGRPNFFLGSIEQQRALGDNEQSITLHLEPFNINQIYRSLRSFDEKIRDEIVALAEKDEKFLEIASRPSLLYIVAILWLKENLSQRENLNSATVIELFIHRTLIRQRKKHDERPFMVLNSAERLYFMSGIAAYMASKNLPNQITHQQLTEAVQLLISSIPDKVSQNVGPLEDARPLRSEERLEWGNKRSEIINRINNDVRSCGLLVTDLSKDSAFKFSHKSYMEFLQAQVIFNFLVSVDDLKKISGKSVANIWELEIADIYQSYEAISFLTDLIIEQFHEIVSKDELMLSHYLWEILVLERLPGRQTLGSDLLSIVRDLHCKFLNQIIAIFGFKNSNLLVLEGAFLNPIGWFFILFTNGGALLLMFFDGIFSSFVDSSNKFLLVTTATLNVFFLMIMIIKSTSYAKSFRYSRIMLWHRVCMDLCITSSNLEKTAGKGFMMTLTKIENKTQLDKNKNESGDKSKKLSG